MPIYEYTCSRCGTDFEALVPRPGAKAPCPECGGRRVRQRISAPGGFGARDWGASCPVSGERRPDHCAEKG